jgi:cytochrome P450
LVSRPEQYQRLARTPSLVAPAVEELLRFDGPAAMVSRFASEDVELGGRSIRQGEAVTIVLGAANRDGRVFDAPDDVDVERSNVNRHLAFGKGTHFCIGAALARLECQIGLRGLVTRFPALQLALPPSALLWRDSLMLRGLLELPVELDPISCL